MITQNCEYCGEIADCDINGLCDDCQSDPEALLEAGLSPDDDFDEWN